MHRAHRAVWVAASASLASTGTLAGDLQTTPILEEIRVTATKSGEISAQSAPFTIQAIGEDAITRGQMQGFDDYSKLVPGLAALNKGPDQTQIMIRGITAGRVSHAEPQNQSTSGLYIDEMPVADNAFNPDLDLFDATWATEHGNLRNTVLRIIALAKSRPKNPFGALRDAIAPADGGRSARSLGREPSPQ